LQQKFGRPVCYTHLTIIKIKSRISSDTGRYTETT
jgi:hypothetical protein